MLISGGAADAATAAAGPEARMSAILELLGKSPLSTEGLRRRLGKQGILIGRRQLFLDLAALQERLGQNRLRTIPRREVTVAIPRDCTQDRAFWLLTGAAAHAVAKPGTVVLGQDELLALEMAHQLLAGAAGEKNPLAAALGALSRRLGAKPAGDAVRVASFGAQEVEGDILRLCLAALRQDLGLAVTYTRIGALEREELAVIPAILSLHEGEWYLAGWCSRSDGTLRTTDTGARLPPPGRIRLLKIACIASCTHLPRPAEPSRLQERAQEALELAFRGHFDGKRQQVDLRFSHLVFEQITRRRWGIRQQVTANAEPGHPRPHRLRFSSAGIEAIVPWLLQYAGEVEVLQPANLRDAIRSAAQALTAAHDPAQNPLPPPMLGEDDGYVLPDPDRAVGCVQEPDPTQYGDPSDQARRAILSVEPVRTVRGIVREVLYTLRNPGPPRRRRQRDLPWAPPPVQGS
jgi:predicted DNA-binding transcriptional regulator YafY